MSDQPLTLYYPKTNHPFHYVGQYTRSPVRSALGTLNLRLTFPTHKTKRHWEFTLNNCGKTYCLPQLISIICTLRRLISPNCKKISTLFRVAVRSQYKRCKTSSTIHLFLLYTQFIFYLLQKGSVMTKQTPKVNQTNTVRWLKGRTCIVHANFNPLPTAYCNASLSGM